MDGVFSQSEQNCWNIELKMFCLATSMTMRDREVYLLKRNVLNAQGTLISVIAAHAMIFHFDAQSVTTQFADCSQFALRKSSSSSWFLVLRCKLQPLTLYELIFIAVVTAAMLGIWQNGSNWAVNVQPVVAVFVSYKIVQLRSSTSGTSVQWFYLLFMRTALFHYIGKKEHLVPLWLYCKRNQIRTGRTVIRRFDQAWRKHWLVFAIRVPLSST